MKLQIKTLNQKSLVIDIEETKTVYDLKKELSLYPDIGVKPELQKLIYAGKVLANEEQLSIYNIDVKKFLVIMILKQPLEEPPKVTQQPQKETTLKQPLQEPPKGTQQPQKETTKEETAKTSEKEKEISTKDNNSPSTPTTEPEFKTPTAPVDPKKEALVAQIVGMGYPESDVRRALAASFYNPERAIEYLIEGIPTTPSTPEGESYSDTDADLSMTPFEVFRADPAFQRLRNALQQNPELLDTAVQRIGETNPALLNLISENQQEFLSMLIDGSDDEEYDDVEMEGYDD